MQSAFRPDASDLGEVHSRGILSQKLRNSITLRRILLHSSFLQPIRSSPFIFLKRKYCAVFHFYLQIAGLCVILFSLKGQKKNTKLRGTIHLAALPMDAQIPNSPLFHPHPQHIYVFQTSMKEK